MGKWYYLNNVIILRVLLLEEYNYIKDDIMLKR